MSRTGKQASKAGFTLIEVMVAVAVLSFAIVMIYQAYFTVTDAFHYCSRYLAVAADMDEKVWQAQDSLERTGELEGQPLEGAWNRAGKAYAWTLAYLPLESDPDSGLFRITLEVGWKQGRRDVKTNRSAYALYRKPD